jgi:hypothetical protein
MSVPPAPAGCWFPYLNGTSQGPTPEDARRDAHIIRARYAPLSPASGFPVSWSQQVIHKISGLYLKPEHLLLVYTCGFVKLVIHIYYLSFVISWNFKPSGARILPRCSCLDNPQNIVPEWKPAECELRDVISTWLTPFLPPDQTASNCAFS